MKFYQAILFFLIFAAENTYADTASVTQTADFGTVTQTAESTVATLGTDGGVTWNGGSGSGSARQGVIRYEVECSILHVLQMPNGISGGQSGENCEFSLNNLQFNPSSFWLSPHGILGNLSQEINVGAELTIDGYCKAGTYTSTIAVSASTYTCAPNDVQLTFSVTIAEKLGISAKQDINFGAMMSPSADGTVTLSYNGQRSATGGIYLMNNADVSQGIFTIDGTAGRTVYVSLPSEAFIYSGGNALSVNNFTASTGTQFTLASDMADMHIGATLNVPANAPEGDYSGTYTITVSY